MYVYVTVTLYLLFERNKEKNPILASQTLMLDVEHFHLLLTA